MGVCMCGFLICGCVCGGVVMCGCFDNCVGDLELCVLVFTVFCFFFVYVYLYLIVTAIRTTVRE